MADHSEMRLQLQRDFVFMGAYTLAYLGLSAFLRYRIGRFKGLVLAGLAAALSLSTVACDVQENWYFLRALDRLVPNTATAAAGRESPSAGPSDDSELNGLVLAKSRYSRGKWITLALLQILLAGAFIDPQRGWWNITALLLLLGGLTILATAIFYVFPSIIETGALFIAAGQLLATMLLLGSDSKAQAKSKPHANREAEGEGGGMAAPA
jgi:hypothetical protein